MIRLAHGEREKIASLVRELCGVVLDESKDYVIECRLSAVAEEAGCANFSELAVRASRPDARDLRDAIVDAATTRETSFFRDLAWFHVLEHKILPELVDRKSADARAGEFRAPIRIWSAGCSTGQEAYSVAMIVRELFEGLEPWPARLVATDVSEGALRRAREGTYTQAEVDRGLKASFLEKYAIRVGRGWRIREDLRAMVDFSRRNLLDDFACLGRFDVILCRNVAIYFAPEVRDDLFARLVRALLPGGCLLLGAAESLQGSGRGVERREYLGAIYYERPLVAPPSLPADARARGVSRRP